MPRSARAVGVTIAVVVIVVTIVAAALLRSGGDDEDDTAELPLIKPGRLIVGTAAPFPPFVIGEPADLSGYEIEVVDAIAARLDLQPTYKDLGFSALFGELAEHRVDLVAPATAITDVYEQTIDFADPHYESQLALVVPDDSDVGGAEDLEGVSVGVRDASAAQTYATEQTSANRVRTYPDETGAVAAIREGEVEAALVSQPVANAALDIDIGVEVVSEIPTQEFFGLALAEDRDELRDAVNDALAGLEDDGTLDEIHQRYFGTGLSDGAADASNEPR